MLLWRINWRFWRTKEWDAQEGELNWMTELLIGWFATEPNGGRIHPRHIGELGRTTVVTVTWRHTLRELGLEIENWMGYWSRI